MIGEYVRNWPPMDKDEFDRAWASLGETVRIVARARRVYDERVIRFQDMTPGRSIRLLDNRLAPSCFMRPR